MQTEPYHKTCANAPLHPSFVASIGEQVRNETLTRDEALEQLQHAIGQYTRPGLDARSEAEQALAAYSSKKN